MRSMKNEFNHGELVTVGKILTQALINIKIVKVHDSGVDIVAIHDSSIKGPQAGQEPMSQILQITVINLSRMSLSHDVLPLKPRPLIINHHPIITCN